jgi:hypothetical protein
MIGVVLAAAAAAVAAVDRLLAFAVTRRVARRIGAVAGADRPPRVRVSGPSFLTQLIGGRFRQVEVTVGTFAVNGLEFAGLEASLSEVRAPARWLLAGDGLTAGGVTATAFIPLTALAERLPSGLSLGAQDGDLRIFGTVALVPVWGRLAVRAERQRLRFTPLVTGRLPAPLGFVISVPGLPGRLGIMSVRVTAAGLEVSLRGTDVVLAAPGHGG